MSDERNLQARVIRFLKSQEDVFFFKVHGSVSQLRGLPDLCGNVGPLAFYIELKAPGRKLTALQDTMARRIMAKDGAYLCARSLEEVEGFIGALQEKNGKSPWTTRTASGILREPSSRSVSNRSGVIRG